MAEYGYARVSTREQNEARQLDALREYGVLPCNIIVEKQSGRDFDRPEYLRLMRRLRRGDLLIVKSIDRLGRSYAEIIEQWRLITKDKQADIVVIDMLLLDTRRGKDLMGTFISDVVLQLLSFVAENERLSIRRRQAEGIAAARMRGARLGRPEKPLPEGFDRMLEAWERKRISMREIIRQCGISESTFFRRLKAYRALSAGAARDGLS